MIDAPARPRAHGFVGLLVVRQPAKRFECFAILCFHYEVDQCHLHERGLLRIERAHRGAANDFALGEALQRVDAGEAAR